MSSDDNIVRGEAVTYAQLSVLPDDALMMHLRRGYADALAVLFDRYHRLVMKVALRILRDCSEAEDLMQSVFLEIFRSASQYDESKGTTKLWILQYAYHRSFNQRRYLILRGFYRRPDEFAPAQDSLAAINGKPSGKLESLQSLREALSRLSKVQRRVLELAFFDGLTMYEIAERVDISFDSVRHHYYRGLEKLRTILYEKPDLKSKASQRHNEDVAPVRS
jgi:RNA polymerase sigma-70 factor (ECF subfamily)